MIDTFSNWGEVKDYILRLSNIIFQNVHENNTKITNKIISCIQSHIQDNLSKDLSIISLGELVHLNPSYLSKLYKKETGKSITDYIADRKLDISEKLLKADNLKICDIANKLGFSTHAYFTRFFKSKTGMSPHEYRNIFFS